MANSSYKMFLMSLLVMVLIFTSAFPTAVVQAENEENVQSLQTEIINVDDGENDEPIQEEIPIEEDLKGNGNSETEIESSDTEYAKEIVETELEIVDDPNGKEDQEVQGNAPGTEEFELLSEKEEYQGQIIDGIEVIFPVGYDVSFIDGMIKMSGLSAWNEIELSELNDLEWAANEPFQLNLSFKLINDSGDSIIYVYKQDFSESESHVIEYINLYESTVNKVIVYTEFGEDGKLSFTDDTDYVSFIGDVDSSEMQFWVSNQIQRFHFIYEGYIDEDAGQAFHVVSEVNANDLDPNEPEMITFNFEDTLLVNLKESEIGDNESYVRGLPVGYEFVQLIKGSVGSTNNDDIFELIYSFEDLLNLDGLQSEETYYLDMLLQLKNTNDESFITYYFTDVLIGNEILTLDNIDYSDNVKKMQTQINLEDTDPSVYFAIPTEYGYLETDYNFYYMYGENSEIDIAEIWIPSNLNGSIIINYSGYKSESTPFIFNKEIVIEEDTNFYINFEDEEIKEVTFESDNEFIQEIGIEYLNSKVILDIDQYIEKLLTTSNQWKNIHAVYYKDNITWYVETGKRYLNNDRYLSLQDNIRGNFQYTLEEDNSLYVKMYELTNYDFNFISISGLQQPIQITIKDSGRNPVLTETFENDSISPDETFIHDVSSLSSGRYYYEIEIPVAANESIILEDFFYLTIFNPVLPPENYEIEQLIEGEIVSERSSYPFYSFVDLWEDRERFQDEENYTVSMLLQLKNIEDDSSVLYFYQDTITGEDLYSEEKISLPDEDLRIVRAQINPEDQSPFIYFSIPVETDNGNYEVFDNVRGHIFDDEERAEELWLPYHLNQLSVHYTGYNSEDIAFILTKDIEFEDNSNLIVDFEDEETVEIPLESDNTTIDDIKIIYPNSEVWMYLKEGMDRFLITRNQKVEEIEVSISKEDQEWNLLSEEINLLEDITLSLSDGYEGELEFDVNDKTLYVETIINNEHFKVIDTWFLDNPIEVTITDTEGDLVLKEEIFQLDTYQFHNISELPSGTYSYEMKIPFFSREFMIVEDSFTFYDPITPPENYEFDYLYEGVIRSKDNNHLYDRFHTFSELLELEELKNEEEYVLDLVVKLNHANDDSQMLYYYTGTVLGEELFNFESIILSGENVKKVQAQINQGDDDPSISFSFTGEEIGYFAPIFDDIGTEINEFTGVAEVWVPHHLTEITVHYTGYNSDNVPFILSENIVEEDFDSIIDFSNENTIEVLLEKTNEEVIEEIDLFDDGSRVSMRIKKDIDRFLITQDRPADEIHISYYKEGQDWRVATDTLNFSEDMTLSLTDDYTGELEIDVNDNTLYVETILSNSHFKVQNLWNWNENIQIKIMDEKGDMVLNERTNRFFKYQNHDISEFESGTYQYVLDITLSENESIVLSDSFTIYNVDVTLEEYEFEHIKDGVIRSLDNEGTYEWFYSFNELMEFVELQNNHESYSIDMLLQLRNENNSSVFYYYTDTLTGEQILSLEEIELTSNNMNQIDISTFSGYDEQEMTFNFEGLSFHYYDLEENFSLWFPDESNLMNVRYSGSNIRDRGFYLFKDIYMEDYNSPLDFTSQFDDALEVTIESEEGEVNGLNIYNEEGYYLSSFADWMSSDITVSVTPDQYRFMISSRETNESDLILWNWSSDLIDLVELDANLTLTLSNEIESNVEVTISDEMLQSEYSLYRGDFYLYEIFSWESQDEYYPKITINKINDDGGKEEVASYQGYFMGSEKSLEELNLSLGTYEYVVSVQVSTDEVVMMDQQFMIESEDNDNSGDGDTDGGDTGNGDSDSPDNGGGNPPIGGGGFPTNDESDPETVTNKQTEEELQGEEAELQSTNIDVSESITTKENDEGVITQIVQVDDQAIQEALNTAEEVNQFIIDLSSIESEAVDIQLSGQSFEAMINKNEKAVLEMVVDQVSYQLPIEEIQLDQIIGQLGGTSAEGVQVSIQINKVSHIQLTNEQNKLDMTSEIYEFEIKVTSRDNEVKVDQFNQYVERSIIGEQYFDPNRSIAVRLNDDGTFTPIPTIFDGKEAIIKSNSNSKYVVVENSVSFTDIDGWYQQSIEKLASKYIVNGISETEFAPNQVTTRAQLAAMLVRSLDLKTTKDYSANFTDVSGSEWYVDELNAAVEAGIIQGYDDNTFRPNDHITREQAAAIIYRAMNLVQYEQSKLNQNIEISHKYSDYTNISDWAREAMQVVAQAGILGGKTEDTIEPSSYATRAEVTIMIERFLKLVGFMN
ncbi:S-layer homology domain-containing protein [Chengkuizengella axinellae]|uniref:S-layer homology domain-containing protein n=1 Tax=Chengkuizengella axinellae TaxID=3064388 RepID=A0ABT9IZM5_9BACL|nr:S-layer homology domain-containing protein [Chengkuizengella sp. 2205SS18-9]MDP5274816.1 S-layer homology domain-containing protein [Chengkuizengella sp. 2205SS18-9]